MLFTVLQVEWDDEKSCFETFAQETADFFALKSKWISPDDEDDDNEESFEVTTYNIYRVVGISNESGNFVVR